MAEQYSYDFQPGNFAASQPDLLKECSDLYSKHYGFWRPKDLLGEKTNVTLSPARIRKWLGDTNHIVLARAQDGSLIAYAIAEQILVPKHGAVTWVTQLVVHADHRRNDVAKTLLFSLFGHSDHFCWGLVSANPYAVRALEKATRRRCDPRTIERHRRFLFRIGAKYVEYINKDTEFNVSSTESSVDTEFDLDHSMVPEMITRATTHAVPWRLGRLLPGWEWLAFTFQDQSQMELTEPEVRQMLDASDDIVRKAYARMTLDDSHVWAQHTVAEVDYIIATCGLSPGQSVLDVGCGIGRHANEFARRGFEVTGVDYSPELILRAKSLSESETTFEVGDFRSMKLDRKFDAVICLYDVIGSFASKADNMRLVRNLKQHVNDGGYVVASVMNMTLTKARAKNFFSLKDDRNKLLDLQPSNTMESTGNVFDPSFLLIDQDENIVYRKEQFGGSSLPAEYIVRDRRYTVEEISSLFKSVLLDVLAATCVRAGDWVTPLSEHHQRAKEILLVCHNRKL